MVSYQNDLGIYIHIPFCHTKCYYCDFPSYGHLDAYHDSYVEALLTEIDMSVHAHESWKELPVSTIYIGGGTPSILKVSQLERIIQTIRNHFAVSSTCEISMEANPGAITLDSMVSLVKAGVTRLSLGVQSIHNPLLASIGRIHTREDVESVLADTVKAKVPSVNVDFMYGLPGQTLSHLEETMSWIQSAPVSHVSIYGLQLEETTLLYNRVTKGDVILPADDMVDDMYDYVMDTLPTLGFERYEISNFAQQGSYSQHNLRYWHYKPYIGFGSGAHSFFGHQRWSNTPYVVPYITEITKGKFPHIENDILGMEREEEDFCFLALRTRWGLSPKTFDQLFPHSFFYTFGDTVQNLVTKGLLSFQNDAYCLTPLGAKHGNYVFSQFIRS